MKIKMLFALNTDQSIISLKNIMYEMGGEFQFYFAGTFDEAEKVMKENDIDFVFSELEIAGRKGVELLKFAQEEYPKIIRIIVLDTCDKNEIKSGIQIAHKIICKPIEQEFLKKCLGLKINLQKYLVDENLIRCVNQISELPTLPAIYEELEKELAMENVSMNRIGNIVSSDISFTAKVLQMINSSFYGLTRKINNPQIALNLLGMNILKSLMLYHQLYSKQTIEKELHGYFEKMWTHSNRIGRFAQELIHLSLNDELEMLENAYIAGLLHDIGKIVMLGIKGYPYKVFEVLKTESIRFSEAEKKVFGSNHTEIGAYFLTLWNIPVDVVEAVYLHNKEDQINFSRFNVSNAVYIANQLAKDEDMDIHKIRQINKGALPSQWMQYIRNRSL